jgi:2'-5' RNA ligase
LRVFFALLPDAEVAQQLARVARQLNLEGRGRLVDPKNYHLTLAFIGEVANSRLAVLQHVGRALQAPRFTMDCESLEYWPRPQVVAATVREISPALRALWTRLNEAVGLPMGELRAHVTLARKVAQAPVQQAMSRIVWRATSFSLIRSETGGAESVYTVVDTWPLLDETQNSAENSANSLHMR